MFAVPDTESRFVAKLVEVEFEEVLFTIVTFWKVDEENAVRPWRSDATPPIVTP